MKKTNIILLSTILIFVLLSSVSYAALAVPYRTRFYYQYGTAGALTQVGASCWGVRTCSAHVGTAANPLFCQQQGNVYAEAKSEKTANAGIAWSRDNFIYNINWDTDQNDCECYGKEWISSASKFESGTTSRCCGDDSNENVESRNCYTGTVRGTFCTSSTSDDACCTATTDCVYDNICYTANNLGVDLDGDSKPDAACNWQATYGRWIDCDQNDWWCGQCDLGAGILGCIGTDCYIKTGETSSHGEYLAGETECCGDDATEYTKKCRDFRKEYPTGFAYDSILEWCQDSLVACCDDKYDCIDKDNNCKKGFVTGDPAATPYENLNPGGVDNIAYAEGLGVVAMGGQMCYWLDCDEYHSNYCDGYCRGGTTESGGAKSGETSFHGEYSADDISANRIECCGDDMDEYYINIGHGPSKCCDDATDCIDIVTGECRPGGTCVEKCWVPDSTAVPAPGTMDYGDEDGDGFSDYDNRDGLVGDSTCLTNATSVGTIKDTN